MLCLVRIINLLTSSPPRRMRLKCHKGKFPFVFCITVTVGFAKSQAYRCWEAANFNAEVGWVEEACSLLHLFFYFPTHERVSIMRKKHRKSDNTTNTQPRCQGDNKERVTARASGTHSRAAGTPQWQAEMWAKVAEMSHFFEATNVDLYVKSPDF